MCLCVCSVVTITSGLISYPIDTIRRRMMMTSGEAVKYSGSLDCCIKVIRAEGFMALMKGAGNITTAICLYHSQYWHLTDNPGMWVTDWLMIIIRSHQIINSLCLLVDRNTITRGCFFRKRTHWSLLWHLVKVLLQHWWDMCQTVNGYQLL